jgi:co-chaperonin GroES (HSP10)
MEEHMLSAAEMTTDYKLMAGFALIEPRANEAVTAGGIIRAERYAPNQPIGTVVSVNPHAHYDCGFVVGDEVVYARTRAHKFDTSDDRVLDLVKIENIEAVIA